MVVERLGKLSSIERPGWFIAIPVIDKIAYRVSFDDGSWYLQSRHWEIRSCS